MPRNGLPRQCEQAGGDVKAIVAYDFGANTEYVSVA